jgi:3-deoxy-manno-octulosonate cytidylyltransferase (CMP-KDO synthetase)
MVLKKKVAFTVIIPARLGSTRLANKALIDIEGLPMVVRTAKQAMDSDAHLVMVATDSQEIQQVCTAYGIRVAMTSTTHQSGSERIAEVCSGPEFLDDDLVINVQGDEPLIDPQLINALAQYHQEQPILSCATAAHGIDNIDDYQNPNIVKVVYNQRGHALYFSRAPIPHIRLPKGTQSLEDTRLAQATVSRHIGIYSYRVGFLRIFPTLTPSRLEYTESLEQLRLLWHGYSIGVYLSQQKPSPGVDTPETLNHVRQIVREQNL